MAGFLVFSIFLVTTIAFLVGISIYQAHMLSRTPLFQCGYNLTIKLDVTCKDKLTIAKDRFLAIKKECIDNNLNLFPPKFQQYLSPCLNEYETGNEVCESHNKFKICLRRRASQVNLRPAVNEYVQMLSEKLTNSTAKTGLLTITDRSLSNGGPDAGGFNGTSNGIAEGPTSNDGVNPVNQSAENAGQVVSDAKEGIAQSARVGNKLRTEDPRQFEFSEAQINECQKMTTCLQMRLDTMPIHMDGVDIRSAQNAG